MRFEVSDTTITKPFRRYANESGEEREMKCEARNSRIMYEQYQQNGKQVQNSFFALMMSRVLCRGGGRGGLGAIASGVEVNR